MAVGSETLEHGTAVAGGFVGFVDQEEDNTGHGVVLHGGGARGNAIPDLAEDASAGTVVVLGPQDDASAGLECVR